ncbi:MAG: hypothetical protein O2890_09290 [Cyanobacteria bacterium]|nr:hypothetical protein [Cyanobacteriota bacterium]MDA0866600.1 hypothetical protein [Cyanobacteriota bacterium]
MNQVDFPKPGRMAIASFSVPIEVLDAVKERVGPRKLSGLVRQLLERWLVEQEKTDAG